MLEDRSYMKEPVFGRRRSLTITLLIILGICYVVQSILLSYRIPGGGILQFLPLTREAITNGYLWQFLTFQFLHDGFLHVLFNGIALYFLGRAMEAAVLPRHWLMIYFGSGFAGGLFHVLGNLILPSHFAGAVVGASAGVSGLLAAFCFIFPAQEILLFFVLPVPARFIFIFSVLLSTFFILVPAGGAGFRMAHGAHLGGLLFGYAYVRWLMHYDWRLPSLPSFRIRKPKLFIHKGGGKPGAPPSAPEIPSEEFISQEVDPILDKISAHGIQSLTERERKILEAARAKMARRL